MHEGIHPFIAYNNYKHVVSLQLSRLARDYGDTRDLICETAEHLSLVYLQLMNTVSHSFYASVYTPSLARALHTSLLAC